MNRIIIHCGEGRGKTSSAIGTLMRSIAHGKKVFAAQFFKPQTDSALEFIQKNSPLITVKNYGCWYFIDKPDTRSAEVFNNAVDEIISILENGDFDTVLLDEIFYTVQFKLLDVQKIIDIMNRFDGKCFILTGRYAPDELLKIADTVSRNDCEKHAFDQGIKAQKGVEF